jgi:hypothetical protein
MEEHFLALVESATKIFSSICCGAPHAIVIASLDVSEKKEGGRWREMEDRREREGQGEESIGGERE